jgi:hypothetical protein
MQTTTGLETVKRTQSFSQSLVSCLFLFGVFMTLRERFLKHIKKNEITGCMEWQGEKHPYGYGRFYVIHKNKNRKQLRVLSYRFMWELFNGPIPKELELCHYCDNPPCCNIDHLFLGTHKENMKDAGIKGKMGGPRGEANKFHVLQNKDVVKIKQLGVEGKLYHREIGEIFNVSQVTISKIIRGVSWNHIQG